MWLKVAECVAVVPSPKFHAYVAMLPKWAPEAEASKEVGDPTGAGATVNEAVGAWSGVIEMASGEFPTGIGVPAVLVAVLMGVTSSEPVLDT